MGACILVVEDNLLNRQLVRDILRHRGHEVLEAATVEEGRARLKEARPDLILMDIQIPGGGGELLLREIRRDPALAHLVVLALTAFAMHGDRDRLLSAGFDGYMSKPIDTRGFAPAIESYLSEKGASDAR